MRLIIAMLIGVIGVVLIVRVAPSGFMAWRHNHSEISSLAYDSFMQGQAYLERRDRPGNIDRAIDSFNAALRSDTSFAPAYAALGEAHWHRYVLERDPKALDRAESLSKRAIAINDQLPIVHITLGRIHAERNQRELALDEMQHALQLDPHNASGLRGLAAIYAQMDRPKEAELYYREAIALRPESWIGYNDFANFYYDRRDFEKAAEQSRRAIALTPDNSIAHSNYALAVQELGRINEAEAELKRALQLDPSYRAYTMLGRFYYSQRRWKEAAATILKAVPLNDTDYRLWANLGLAYEWLNNDEKAQRAYDKERELLEQTFRLKPDDPEVLSELGLLYAREGDNTRAVPLVQHALALRANDPWILHNPAEAFAHLGNRPEALRLLKRALDNGCTVEDLELNPGLRNLRLDPGYRHLVASVKRSAQQ